MFIRRWNEVRNIIMETDQIEMGRKILEMLYEELGLSTPEWLRKVEVKYDIEAPTPEEIFFDTIWEDLQEAIRKADMIIEVKDYGMEKVDLLRENWVS